MFVINNHINKHKYASHYHYKNIITKKLVHELLLFQSRYIETDHSSWKYIMRRLWLHRFYVLTPQTPHLNGNALCFQII